MEADGAIHRRGQFVDGGDAVLRIDEQPFPIERDHIDLQRLNAFVHRLPRLDPVNGAVRIEKVSAGPGQGAQADDDQQGRSPDHDLQMGRVVPVRLVFRVLVRRPVLPGEEYGQRHHWNDDDQHQQGGDHQQVALLLGDVAGGFQHDQITGRQKRHHGHEQE